MQFCTRRKIESAVRLPPGSIPWGIRCEQREEGRVEIKDMRIVNRDSSL